MIAAAAPNRRLHIYYIEDCWFHSAVIVNQFQFVDLIAIEPITGGGRGVRPEKLSHRNAIKHKKWTT
jgi:hypothetical protein